MRVEYIFGGRWTVLGARFDLTAAQAQAQADAAAKCGLIVRIR